MKQRVGNALGDLESGARGRRESGSSIFAAELARDAIGAAGGRRVDVDQYALGYSARRKHGVRASDTRWARS